jgi:hypothetical protein
MSSRGHFVKKHLLAASAVIALLASGSSFAQETSQGGAVLTYEPAFFAEYSPITAADMVSQVPGFSINDGAQVRALPIHLPTS